MPRRPDALGTLDAETLGEIADEVRVRGLAAVAREMDFPRQTLGSVLCGASRVGSRELAIARWRARAQKAQQEAHSR